MAKFKNRHFLWPALAIAVLATALITGIDALTARHLDYFFPFVSYGGTFAFPSVNLAGHKLSLYPTFMIVGIIAMCIISCRRRDIIGKSAFAASTYGIVLALIGIIGAKLLYILENIASVKQEGLTFGGFSFFGAVLFIPVFLYPVSRLYKLDYYVLVDFSAPMCAAILAFIRIGCFCGGCCGANTAWIGGNPFIFPVQLVEAAFDFLVLYILYGMEEHHIFDRGRYVFFIGAYGTYRFVLEFIRIRECRFLIFSNGHIFSVICIAIMILYFKTKRNRS